VKVARLAKTGSCVAATSSSNFASRRRTKASLSNSSCWVWQMPALIGSDGAVGQLYWLRFGAETAQVEASTKPWRCSLSLTWLQHFHHCCCCSKALEHYCRQKRRIAAETALRYLGHPHLWWKHMLRPLSAVGLVRLRFAMKSCWPSDNHLEFAVLGSVC